ncbi:MAG: hypothetical protein HYZ36_02390 [Pedosphaera parvula]|nr:hypothetical protein [Pedosphaera parvula]
MNIELEVQFGTWERRKVKWNNQATKKPSWAGNNLNPDRESGRLAPSGVMLRMPPVAVSIFLCSLVVHPKGISGSTGN